MSVAIHRFAGRPGVDAATRSDGTCWMCGARHVRACTVREWMPPTFLGAPRVACPSSATICEACVWICSRTSPVPGRPPAAGKKLGGNFRNYSHMVEFDGEQVIYGNASKADNEAIVTFLRRPKAGAWWCAIAESGQKHVIPWARRNGPGAAGSVAYEELAVPLTSEYQWQMFDAIEGLLARKIPRGAILDGRWTVELIRKHGEAIGQFDNAWQHERGGAWFRLACQIARNHDKH